MDEKMSVESFPLARSRKERKCLGVSMCGCYNNLKYIKDKYKIINKD